MYGIWFALTLLLASGAGWADAERVQIGMSRGEVKNLVGRADSEFLRGNLECDQAYYHHTDYLGGVSSLSIAYLNRGGEFRVNGFKTYYSPFAVTPPWLEALRDKWLQFVIGHRAI